ncbi:MAG TPA: hypothetical protein VGM62_06895 [Chthoniobacterales bacterium]|jgi:hypothetical protein
MNYKHAFSGFSFLIVALAALALPTHASANLIDYSARIVVKDSSGTTLGYVQDDPNYFTPFIVPTSATALVVDFTLNGTAGNQINLAPQAGGGQGYPFWGATVGRDSTSSDIAAVSFNYLYLEGDNGTPAGSTPQPVGNYFTASTAVAKDAESAIWNIDVNALTLAPQWINTDSSTPNTVVFVQSNHVYAGGDSAAFMSRFPAPVINAALFLEIISAVPEPGDGNGGSVPDLPSTGILLMLGLTTVFCLRPVLLRRGA